jgi:hypothetical protein
VEARVHEGIAGGGGDGGARARVATTRLIRVREQRMSANRYDRRDPHVTEASDEPTTGKDGRLSNRRISSAPR